MATFSSFIRSSLFSVSLRAVNSWMIYLHVVLLLWSSCDTSVTGKLQPRLQSADNLQIKVHLED